MAMPAEEENVWEGADDEEEDVTAPVKVPADKREIRTDSADPEIDSLYKKYKKHKLILQPFFQRRFVWDRPKASRLIESTLMRVPLPIIYLSREVDASGSVIDLVVDGQQRLTAFFSYIDGALPEEASNSFRLTGMTVFPELERKLFTELPDALQQRILDYHLRVITILPDSDPELKFDLFKRLNTGAVPLNEMELRNAVSWGPYINLLKELANDPEFEAVVGFQGVDKRMRDLGLVLRFAAFWHSSYLKYQAPMKRFLDQDMDQYRRLTPAQDNALRKAFKNAVAIVRSLFGEHAFYRYKAGNLAHPGGEWETKRFNASLFDVWMGTFADRDKNQVYTALDAVREGLIDLMANNDQFIDAILLGTSQPSRVRTRFDLARLRVDDILQNYKVQPRCFSRKLKEELFAQDPTCAICGQHIQQIDDAAVDHIEQYWRGGQTIPENARLAHRYCNWARSRND